MKWIFIPTNYTCNTRKEMKDYLGGNNKFRSAQRNKDVRYITYNIIATDELQKNHSVSSR